MLNLLPPEIKSQHGVRSKLYTITVLYIVLAGIFVLGPIAVATFNFIQASQVSDYQSQISQIKSQIGQTKDINDKLAFIESRVSGADQFQEQRDWPDYLDIIAKATPPAIVITGLRLEDGAVDKPIFAVTGRSTDRRSVILFKDKLALNEQITQAVFDSISETVVEDSKIFNFSMKVTFSK